MIKGKLKSWYYYELKYQYEKQRDNFCLWLAGVLPKRLVMWCYIKIVSQDGNAPSVDFKNHLDTWGVK